MLLRQIEMLSGKYASFNIRFYYGYWAKTKERLFNEFKSIDVILNADINHLIKLGE